MALKREKWDPLFRRPSTRTQETVDRQLKEDMDYWRDTPWWQNPNVYRDDRNRSRSFAESRATLRRFPSAKGLLGETMSGEYGGLPIVGKEYEKLPPFKLGNIPELALPTPFQNFAREEDILASQAMQRRAKGSGTAQDRKVLYNWLKTNRPNDPRIEKMDKEDLAVEKEVKQAKMMKEMESWKPRPLDIRRAEGVSFQPKFADTPTERAYQESLPSTAKLEQMNLEKAMMDKTMTYNPKIADEDRSLLSEAGEGVQSEARQFARTFNPQSTEDVTKLQGYLKELGYDIGKVDGVLGPATEKALRTLQGVKYTSPTQSAKEKKGSTQQIKKVEDIKKQAETITQGKVDTTESVGSPMVYDPKSYTIGEMGSLQKEKIKKAFKNLIKPTEDYGRIPDDLFGIKGLGTKDFWAQTRPEDSSSYRGR